MGTTIAAVECWVLRAPIAQPVANAFGAMSDRPATFVRVSASDGAWGWGEVFSNFPQVGAEHRARLVTSIFKPLLMDAPADDVGSIRSLLETRTRQMAIQCGEPGPFAQITGAIDQAMWDLSARRAGEPLWRHLGGTNPRVRVYASGIGPDGVVDVALAKRAAGYRAFKLKVGFGAARDRTNLEAMRAALGEEAVLMTDANQAWTPDEAVARIAELAHSRPHWIEEPIMADHHADTWQRLAARCDVRLAAGENLRGLPAFEQAIERRFLRFVQPDVGKWGGISGCRDVAQRAAARGAVFCPHWLAGGVGLAASMHLIAAVGTADSFAEVDTNPNPLREEVFPHEVVDGAVTLSEAVGHGVEPDLVRLARYVVRVE